MFQHSRHYLLNTTIRRISPHINYRAVVTTLHHAKYPVATTTTTTSTRETTTTMTAMNRKMTSFAVISSPPPSSTRIINIPIHQFSSSSSSSQQYQRNSRPSPQYTIYKETSCLTIKPILPTFKSYGDNISLDKPGRMLLELTPRRGSGSGGSLRRDAAIKFALSVEEMGKFLALVPGSFFDVSRSTPSEGGAADIDKSLKIVTNDDGRSVTLVTSVSMDGIEGRDGGDGPVTIDLEPGDVKVMRLLFRSSLTHFVGWDDLLDVGMAQNVGRVTRSSSSARGGYGLRNDNITYGGPKGDLTF